MAHTDCNQERNEVCKTDGCGLQACETDADCDLYFRFRLPSLCISHMFQGVFHRTIPVCAAKGLYEPDWLESWRDCHDLAAHTHRPAIFWGQTAC